MLDTLQIIFWSITYVLIIIAGIQSRNIRKVSMPYGAAIQNFTWEICALIISHGFWGHIVWLSLDIAIIILGFLFASSKRHRIVYATLIPVGILIFGAVFSLENGMLYSSFAIDLLMAIYYLVDRKQLSPKLKIPIAVTKLIGDTCAGLYYAPMAAFVAIIAVFVFLCNIVYLYLCIAEAKQQAEAK